MQHSVEADKSPVPRPLELAWEQSVKDTKFMSLTFKRASKSQ